MDLDILLPGPTEPADTWRWATVTATSPLRVRLDGDTAALSVTPDALVTGLVVGARVWCQIVGRRVVVHGPAGDTGWLPLPTEAGFETKAGVVRYRRIGNLVRLGGLIGPTTGTLAASTTYTVATLPAGFRPAQAEWFTGGNTTAQTPATIVITAAGAIQVRVPATGIAYAGLAGCAFLTD